MTVSTSSPFLIYISVMMLCYFLLPIMTPDSDLFLTDFIWLYYVYYVYSSLARGMVAISQNSVPVVPLFSFCSWCVFIGFILSHGFVFSQTIYEF